MRKWLCYKLFSQVTGNRIVWDILIFNETLCLYCIHQIIPTVPRNKTWWQQNNTLPVSEPLFPLWGKCEAQNIWHWFCLTDIRSDNLKPSLCANCPKTRFVCFPILHNSSLKYLWGIEGGDIEQQIVQMQMSSFLRFFFFSFFVPFFHLFLFFLSFLFFFFRLSVFFFSFFFHVCGEALLVKIHTSVTRLWADTKGRDKAWGVSLATFICDSQRCSSNEGGLNISWQNFGGKPSGAESLLIPVFLSKLVSADLYHTVRRDVTKKIQSLIPDFTRATRHERLGTRLNSKEAL